jgi:hypothetical protein
MIYKDFLFSDEQISSISESHLTEIKGFGVSNAVT